MKDKKIIDFSFSTTVLKSEDFLPIDVLVLKDYYRNTFLDLIDTVRKKYL
jgi:hypothetical protein